MCDPEFFEAVNQGNNGSKPSGAKRSDAWESLLKSSSEGGVQLTSEEIIDVIFATEQELDKINEMLEHSGDNEMLRQARARTLAQIGVLYRHVERYDEAVSRLNEALEEYLTLGDDMGAAIVNGILGSIALETGDYFSAREHFERSLQFWEKKTYLNERMEAMKGLGLALLKSGEEERGASVLLDAAAMATDLEDEYEFVYILTALIHHYEAARKFDIVRELKLKILELWLEIDDLERQFKTLIDIGVLSQVLNEVNDAVYYFGQAGAVAYMLGDLEKIFLAEGFIGEAYLAIRNIPEMRGAYARAYAAAVLKGGGGEPGDDEKKMRMVLLTLGYSTREIDELRQRLLDAASEIDLTGELRTRGAEVIGDLVQEFLEKIE